jgi:hypothetical protein
MMQQGVSLTEEQKKIELERKFTLPNRLIKPTFGDYESANGQSVFEDQIIFLTEDGVHLSHHLSWHESLGDLDQSANSNEWVSVFGKALEIYNGSVKGLRMKH